MGKIKKELKLRYCYPSISDLKFNKNLTSIHHNWDKHQKGKTRKT
jgi:hypothetical protein